MNNFTVLHKTFTHSRIVNTYRQYRLLNFFPQGAGKSFIRLFAVLFLGLIAATNLQAAVITHNIGTQGSLTIAGNSTNDYIITGTTTTNKVIIEANYKGTITLDNVRIRAAADYAAIRIKGIYNGNVLTPITKVNIILKGYNLLESGEGTTTNPKTSGPKVKSDAAALQVDQGAQIHIRAIDENVDASGELVARSYHGGDGGAGIGGPDANAESHSGIGYVKGDSGPQGEVSSWGPGSTTNAKGKIATSGGNIIISSGTIFARGGRCAAGIGSGYTTIFSGNIVIYGGDVTAYGGNHSAGIGTGCPAGNGNNGWHAYSSSIIVLPPAKITATSEQPSKPGLAGANSITYVGDPQSPLVTVKTIDSEKNADIYADLSETTSVTTIFAALGITTAMCDLKKIKFGNTTAAGQMQFRATFKQNVTFFTDASSSVPATLGRPYKPQTTTITAAKTVILPLLNIGMAFDITPSTPLEVGYSAAQAFTNSYKLKVTYTDSKPMTAVIFGLQAEGATDFSGLKFYGADGVTEIGTPTTLTNGQIFHVKVPVKIGKPMGIYQDVFRISGTWDGAPTGYIRQVVTQRVVKDDTNTNAHIQVEGNPNKFTVFHPTTNKVNLNLKINHTGIPLVPYKPTDVTAKYLISTKADYNAALAETPLKDWPALNIPATENINRETVVDFTGKAKGTYYIHWNVVSGVVYAHSRPVVDPPHVYGGFGPYIIYEPIVAGNISGNPSVCAGQAPAEIKGEASIGGSGNFTYQWQISTNNTTWTNVGGNTQNYTPALLTVSPTYYRRSTTDNNLGAAPFHSNTFQIRVVAGNQTLYWKKNAANSNWNDPANWVNASGTALNMVPVSCSDVYIPIVSASAIKYPSLDVANTPVDVYGVPVCNNITFAYGAEVAHPHLLKYNQAYVQYNFGYYSTYNTSQPTQNSQPGSPVLKRDVWHPLAAPLKEMVSGDFAFGGYPVTWQAMPDILSSSNNLNSVNFDKYLGKNDQPLASTNNMIALKVPLWSAQKGSSDQKPLESLKGVLEIPFYEDNTQNVNHPSHNYDPISSISNYYYYDTKTLQRLGNPVGSLKRKNKDAYRFIFEGSIKNITINGVQVPCYTMEVTPNASKQVLIGNPFIASICMDNFQKANSGVIEGTTFNAYKSDEKNWKPYSYAASSVNSFQAFAITLKTTAKITLNFPLEGDWRLTGVTTNRIPRRLETPGALAVAVSNTAGKGGDYAELASGQEQTANTGKLISEEGHALPETFFIDPTGNNYNLIQVYNRDMSEIGLGVKCSDTQSELTLVFDHIEAFSQLNNAHPVLVDKLLGVEQDLTENSTYRFRQHTSANPQSQYADKKRFAIRFNESSKAVSDGNLKVIYTNNHLEVRTIVVATQVEVYNLSGQLLFNSSSINTTNYHSDLSLEQGSYIVKVKTDDDKTTSRKIISTDSK